MIEPRDSDRGRRAYYSPFVGSLRICDDIPGVVTGWNERYVFHRADGETQAKACERRSLFWEDE